MGKSGPSAHLRTLERRRNRLGERVGERSKGSDDWDRQEHAALTWAIDELRRHQRERAGVHGDVLRWLEDERAYAEAKWPPEAHDDLPPEETRAWVEQYLHRAMVLGVDVPLGRQALAKALRTLQAFTESVVRRYGPLPPAGVPSGDVEGAA